MCHDRVVSNVFSLFCLCVDKKSCSYLLYHNIADSNEAITHSFKALVVLLADRLPVSRMGNPEGVGLEGEEEEEEENVEDGHV